MRIVALCVGLMVFSGHIALGQIRVLMPGQSPGEWQDIRKQQPDGVQLKMNLPKDHYYQGEIINASLEFSNTSATPYHLWIGNYDRSGRITDITFEGQDTAGQPVPDPLAWYFLQGGMGGGLGGEDDLKTWTITLPVNQWLRFDKPGVYTLYAFSNRVQKGAKNSGMHTEQVNLVSDKVQITIDALPLEQEKKIIDAAKSTIALGGQLAASAVTELRYLETPAARAELIPLLADQAHSFDASMGLCAAPDASAEAANILAGVSEGKLPLRMDITMIYARLKTRDLVAGFSYDKMTPQSAQDFAQKLMAAQNQARDEITAAALKASGGKGPGYMDVLVTKFQQNNRDPAVRADMVAHQLELSDQQAEGLLSGWDYVGGAEFLPLARKMAGDPSYSMPALKALAKSKPDEAQALLIADAKLPKSNYFTHKYGSISMHHLNLAPTPVADLDSFLRDKLKANTELETTAFYIDQFGTPALLPDVIAAYEPHEGKWTCEIQKFMLQYWMRCDPKGATGALTRALQSRASTGCYKRLLDDVLTDHWNDAALPVVVQALDDPDTEVVLSAIKVLGLHADGAPLDKSIAALERMDAATAAPSTPGTIRRGQASMVARQLLDGSTHLTSEQRQRLEAIDKGH